MKGSEKQIAWATKIKATYNDDFAKFRAGSINPIATKALDYIDSIDNASFWIDNRDSKLVNLLTSLFSSGLQIKGRSYDDVAKMDAKTGEMI